MRSPVGRCRRPARLVSRSSFEYGLSFTFSGNISITRLRWSDKREPLRDCAKYLGLLKEHVVIEDLDARKTRLRAALARVANTG